MAKGNVRRKIKKEAKKLNLLHRMMGIRKITIVALVSGAIAGVLLKSLGAGLGVYFAIQLADKLLKKSAKDETRQSQTEKD